MISSPQRSHALPKLAVPQQLENGVELNSFAQ
jgi:hypothetical protein